MKTYTQIIFIVVMVSMMVMPSLTDDLQKVVSSNNDFSNKLFAEVSGASPNSNIIMSALSVHTLLALLYQGSGGQTENILARTLQLPSQKETAVGYKSLVTSILNTKGVTLSTANKVFLKNGFKLKKSFQATARNDFAADAEELDFAQNIKSAKTINSWVESKTNNKIHDLISPNSLNADTRIVLVNAIYFKGKWAVEFNKKATRKAKFFTSETDSKDVDMMTVTSEFRYTDSDELEAKVLELPYEGEKTSMVIVLPRSKTGIKALESKLTNINLQKVLDSMWSREVIVQLPRFKIESTIKLAPILKKMGLENMFTSAANFSGLADDPLVVSDAIQKAFIEVNEEGTEAAAATAFHGFGASPFVQEKLEFRVDHPFVIYLINKGQSKPTTTVLFTAKVENI